jgi:hypothetical protein
MMEDAISKKIKEMYGDDPKALSVANELQGALSEYLKKNSVIITTPCESEAFMHGMLFAFGHTCKLYGIDVN